MPGLMDIVGGVLTGGLSLAGQAISNRAQSKENQKQRDFEQNMYNQQVFNDRQNWQMQNMYNLPENQMQRLKQAGLNPNLVYGNGTSTVASPVGNATASVSNSTKTGIDPNFMQNAANSALQNIYSAQQSNAQVNLLKQETESQIANRNLMATQGALNNAIKNKTELENAFGKDSYNQRLQQLDLANQKAIADITNIGADTGLKTAMTANTEANTRKTLQQVTIDWQQNKMSLAEAASRILKNKSDIAINQSNIGLNSEKVWTEQIKQKLDMLDLQMGYAGYNRNTGVLNRAGIFFLNNIGHVKTPAEVEKAIDDLMFKLKNPEHPEIKMTPNRYQVTGH